MLEYNGMFMTKLRKEVMGNEKEKYIFDAYNLFDIFCFFPVSFCKNEIQRGSN